MEQQATATRMTQRYVKKREAILHAAAQLFNQHGLKGATLTDVAARVGLSTNSITYYYRKKEDLVVACLLSSIDRLNKIVEQASAEPDAQRRIQRFIGLFFDWLARIERGKAPEMMTFRDVQVLGSPHTEVVFAAYTDLFRRVRCLLAGEGALPPDRVPLNACTHLLLTLTVTARRWCDRYDPDDYPFVAGQMSDILINGLAASGTYWHTTQLDDVLDQAGEEGESAHDAFLRSATALINELGYRGASVDRISARLNVTKGSFYHHNPNKEDLISECFERTFSVTRRMQALARDGAGSGWDKLSAVARALVRYQFSDHGPLLRMSAWSELPDELREDKLRTINRFDQRFVALLAEGMRDGSIRALDQGIAAAQVSGMINASVVLDRWVHHITADNAVELFVRPLFLGILRA